MKAGSSEETIKKAEFTGSHRGIPLLLDVRPKALFL